MSYFPFLWNCLQRKIYGKAKRKYFMRCLWWRRVTAVVSSTSVPGAIRQLISWLLYRLRHFCQSNDLFRPRSQANYKLTYLKVTELIGNGMFMYNISLNALFYLPQNVTWQNLLDTFTVVFPNKLQTLEGAQFEVRIILIIWSSSGNLIGNDVQ